MMAEPVMILSRANHLVNKDFISAPALIPVPCLLKASYDWKKAFFQRESGKRSLTHALCILQRVISILI
jgi:hypothetical protein